MALATQCPHCGTMFRVASDQLKLRGGIVRCGSCQEIFDGSATLVDLEAVPIKAPAPAEPAPALPSLPAPEFAAEPDAAPAPAQAEAAAAVPEDEPLAPLEVTVDLPRFEDQPVYTLDFDHTFDPLGILPKVDAPEAESAATPAQPVLPPWSQLLKDSGPAAQAHPPAAPADAPEPVIEHPWSKPTADLPPPDAAHAALDALALPVDEELVALALPDHEPEPHPAGARARPAEDAPPLPMRESTAGTVSPPSAAHVTASARTPATKRADKAAARRSKLTPTRIESQPKLRAADIDEPDFVKRGRQQEQHGRTRKIMLLAGSLALLVLLFAQGAFTFRNALAARFPAAKPALVSSCAVFGCRVELPAEVDNLAIETGELTTLGRGAYSFTTALRNTGATVQAWPSLELALTDANDKPLVRRVFGPGDYLADGAMLANGIAPRTEQAVKLHFRVDDLKPSGYHVAVFYP